MKISARRGLVASTAGCAVALASTLATLPGTTASAATPTSTFALQAPALTAAQVGQRIQLRVSPTSGDLDCSTLSLQEKTGGAWHNVTHNYRLSGCWTGGANYVTTVTDAMVQDGLRLSGAVADPSAVPLGSVTIGDADPVQRAVTVSTLPQNPVPSSFGWQVGLAQVPADAAIGSRVSLRVDVAHGAHLDCSSIGLERQAANGDWIHVDADLGASGCWIHGALLEVPVSAEMRGSALRMAGQATRTSSTSAPTFVGKATLAGDTQTAPVLVIEKDATPDGGLTAAGSTPTTAPSAMASPSADASPSATPTPSATATPTPSATATPTASASATSTSAPVTAQGDIASLDLPRIPWEGGAAYYNKFADAKAGGWADPSHFPIAVWWGGFSNDADIQADKKLGINTYVQLNQGVDYHLLTRNKVSLIGNQLDGEPRNDPGWVGDYLDDEVDGRMSPDQGLATLNSKIAALPDHNKFRYANFTAMLISQFANNPSWNAASNAYARTTDTISLDGYYYASDQCDWDNPGGSAFKFPFTKDNCRTGQNYGRSAAGLVWRTQESGNPQPVYNFIEAVDPAHFGYTYHELTPDEVKGAAMSSIINEARGLVWFNQSFGGKCTTGNALRSYQDPSYPCRNTVAAMGEVNNLIQSLAPVLNTQSYQWSFGKDISSMLKVQGGDAYIFAMASDTYQPGARTFTLPAQLKGRTITVVGENRTITPNADGTFTDSFATVNSYHVYKLS